MARDHTVSARAAHRSLTLPVTGLSMFTPSEVEEFHRDGFVVARDVIGSDIRQRMLNVSLNGLGSHNGDAEFEADLNYPGAPTSRDDPGGRTVRRLKQAFSRDAVFAEYVMLPEITSRLQQLLERPIVMPLAHHNCIMTKAPEFSSDTGWHQDVRYWSFEKPELISLWLALGPERQENGSLLLIPGSHRLDLPTERFDDELFLRDNVPANVELIESAVPTELDAGDCLFFHCRTLHAASRNRTDQTKYSVVFTFRSIDNPPVPETRSASLPEVLIG